MLMKIRWDHATAFWFSNESRRNNVIWFNTSGKGSNILHMITNNVRERVDSFLCTHGHRESETVGLMKRKSYTHDVNSKVKSYVYVHVLVRYRKNNVRVNNLAKP